MKATMDETTVNRVCLAYVTARHRVVVLGSTCVAVQELQTGEWLEEHSALDEHVTLEAGVSNGERLASFQLVAHSFGLRLVLGRVLAVKPPSADVCAHVAQLPRFGHVARAVLERAAQDAPARRVA